MFQIEFPLLNEGCKLKKANNLGDSLAVELAALTRAALVQIQVPQPFFYGIKIVFKTFISIKNCNSRNCKAEFFPTSNNFPVA